MDFGFEGFESSDFDIELEDVKVKRIKKFDRIWKWSLGGSVTYHVLDGNAVYFSSLDTYLYSVDIRTGEILWRFKAGGAIFGSPSNVIKGMIAAGSYDGVLYLVEAKTGKEIWRFKTGGPISVGPTMTKDSVLVGSKDGHVYCLGLDGMLKWRFKTGDEIAFAVTPCRNRIFFGGFDSYFYCLDKDTGKEIWRFKTGGEIVHDRQSLVHKNVVYFGSWDNYFYALDTETGKEIWRFKAGEYGVGGPASLCNDKIIFPAREGVVYAVSLEGKELWRFRASSLVISVTVYDGKIFFTSEDGNMYVLSPEGEEMWRFKFGEGGSYDYPTLYKDMVLVGSMDCHFYAIDANTGKEIWRVNTSSQTRSTAPPPHEEFKVEIKKEIQVEESTKKKYKTKEETVSLSDYRVESEYNTESEYRQKSDYDVEWVMFENAMEVERIWHLSSEDLNPDFRI